MASVATPIAVRDVVDGLRAHLPLLELPADLEGICEFAIMADPGQESSAAMAWAEVREGRVVASGSGRPSRPGDSWARGTITVDDDRHRPSSGRRPCGRGACFRAGCGRRASLPASITATDPRARSSGHRAVIAVQLLRGCNYWVPSGLRRAPHNTVRDAWGMTLRSHFRMLNRGDRQIGKSIRSPAGVRQTA